MLFGMLMGTTNLSDGDLSSMEASMGFLEPLRSCTVQIIIVHPQFCLVSYRPLKIMVFPHVCTLI